MTVEEFESTIWRIEGVCIVVRAPTETDLGDYAWVNAAPVTWSVTEWLDKRVYPLLDGHQIVVLQGNGQAPHGRMLMRNLRHTYG